MGLIDWWSTILEPQVMMIGGRRCGKTSILSVMQYRYDRSGKIPNLQIVLRDPNTRRTLTDVYQKMQDYFINPNIDSLPRDNGLTSELANYSFELQTGNKAQEIIEMKVLDYPGGWLTREEENKDHRKELEKYMSKSQALIIAIDTPHMMEENGIFNERRNLCNDITETLKAVMPREGKKLILFVPLKCERYKNRGKMNEVTEKVKDSYLGFINFLKSRPDQFEVAITPIFTLGNAEFDHFERDERGNIKLQGKYSLPDGPIYKLTGNKCHNPEFCEQPMLYLLAFMQGLAEDYKNDAFFFKRWSSNAARWAFNIGQDMDDYKKLKDHAKSLLRTAGYGYALIQDPMALGKKG